MRPAIDRLLCILGDAYLVYSCVTVHRSTKGAFSRMRSEGFPLMVWGSGGWTRVRRQLVGASFSHRFSRRFRVVNSVSIGEAAKPRVFC